MLLEIAIGDAYGAAFEFAPDGFISENNKLDKYPERQSKYGYTAGGGKYTDDTQMSMAIVEHILNKDAYHPIRFAERFLTTYQRDIRGRAGYSSRMVDALSNSKCPLDFLKNAFSTFDSNGCVMRTVPFGLIKDLHEAESASIAQCVTTHMSSNAIIATRMVTLASWYLNWNQGKKKDLYTWLRQYFHDWNLTAHVKKPRIECDAIMTASAAIFLVYKYKKMSDILYHGVALKGDTDSVCSIAMGLASVCNEIEPDIPQILFDTLENEQFGKDYIINLDNQLYDRQKKLKS